MSAKSRVAILTVFLSLGAVLGVLLNPVFGQNSIIIKNMPTKQNPSLKPSVTICGIRLEEKWPLNFAVPKYTSNVVSSHFSNSVKGEPSAAAMLVTTDQPKNVYVWYQDACRTAGWKFSLPTDKALSKMSKHGECYFIDANKEKQHAFICFTANKKPPGTLISISWSLRR